MSNKKEKDKLLCDENCMYYGRMPDDNVAPIIHLFNERVHDNEDLNKLKHASDNGYKMYLKSRPDASLASVRRSKLLPREGIHPLFLNDKLLNDHMQKQILLKKKMKEFRPEVSAFIRKVSSNKNSNVHSIDNHVIYIYVIYIYVIIL